VAITGIWVLFAGVVTIATQLDYDVSPNTTFVVVAYDNGVPSLSSTATVFVQLSDTNNYRPVFDPVRGLLYSQLYIYKQNWLQFLFAVIPAVL